ncbi:unnamed protein product [Meganyctiphanes norvegica]|uniref:MAGE domain-containing protein n=1 Tax=Meganyctiphanes norvegica TaxID=48144 RepID=A0AAV2RN69_MEGNR
MPPKKKSIVPSQATQEVSDEEMDEDDNMGSQSSQALLSDNDRRTLAGHVVNYMLVADCKKVPVKRSEINKGVLKEHSKQFNNVMAEVTRILSKVYGYRVVDLEKGQYILVNNMSPTLRDHDVFPATRSRNDAATMGLVTAILAGIFMSGELMQEGPMREYMKKLRIDIDSKDPHAIFGNVNKLIMQDLVKQCYLSISFDKSTDPPSKEFRWGPRAHVEISKKHMLELVCKIYGDDMRPEQWASQWKVVQREAAESAGTS